MTLTNSSSLDEQTAVGRGSIEDFLYREAELLDDWKLDEWIELFEPGATYHVPATDLPAGRPESSLFLVADDWVRLNARVKRLMSKNAHVENPRSRTRRIIGNVRFNEIHEDQTIAIRANFIIYRWRYEIADQFVGRYEYVVLPTADGLRIRSRKAILDLESLRPSGKVSIIL